MDDAGPIESGDSPERLHRDLLETEFDESSLDALRASLVETLDLPDEKLYDAAMLHNLRSFPACREIGKY